MTTANTYDLKTVRYHWLSAILIVALWILGQTIDDFAKGDPRVYARSMHITLGLILAVVFVLRFTWRLKGGTKLPPAAPGVQGKLAIGVHHLLYLLIAVTVGLGIFAVWARGDNIFNLFRVPVFDPTDKELREQVVDIHGLLANSLLILAAGHAALAIWHHVVMKDGVLKRILPFLK